jgi:phenylacetate-CoA ligase
VFPVVQNIVGRQTSFLITPDGREVTIFNHIPRGIPNLIEMQFRQEDPAEIEVLIVVTESFGDGEMVLLQDRLKNYISPQTNFLIRKVPDIPRSPGGKFQIVDQRLTPQFSHVSDLAS